MQTISIDIQGKETIHPNILQLQKSVILRLGIGDGDSRVAFFFTDVQEIWELGTKIQNLANVILHPQ